MPYYPSIEWDNNLLDPRGFYLDLNELNKRKKNISGKQLITSEFLGKYQRNIFVDIENSSRSDETSLYYKKGVRYVQIHNEFLFFSKRRLSCTNSYLKNMGNDVLYGTYRHY